MRTVLYLSPLRKLCSKIEPVSTLRSLALITAPARASLMCSTPTMDSNWPSISNIMPLRKSLVEIIPALPRRSNGSGHREIWRSRWSEPKARVDRLGAHRRMRDDVGPGPATRGSGRMGSKDPVIRLSLLRQELQCHLISHKSEPRNHAAGGARGHAPGAEFLARVDIREVHLHDRERERLEAVEERQRVVGQGPGIDDDAGRAGGLLLQEVDDLALVVALEEADLEAQLLGFGAHGLVEVVEGARPVDVRLPPAEQVQVRPVDDDDPLHASALVTTRRTIPAGTAWPISAWPIRRGITHATLPRLAFLSRAIAARTLFGSTRGGLSGRPKASSSASCVSTNRLLHRSMDSPMRAATRMPNATARPCVMRKPVAASSACPAVCP